jgi:hypothetical protein
LIEITESSRSLEEILLDLRITLEQPYVPVRHVQIERAGERDGANTDRSTEEARARILHILGPVVGWTDKDSVQDRAPATLG